HARAGYELYYLDSRDQQIHEAQAKSSLPHSFDRVPAGAGLLQGGAITAPVVVQDNRVPRRWLWGDSYAPVNGELFVWQASGPDSSDWKVASKTLYTQPANAKLGGITGITATERSSLLAHYGTPSWR